MILILICSLKSLGKNLQNELWAHPVPSKLSERWPTTLFLAAEMQNGHTQKKFGQFLQCNLKVYSGYHMKACGPQLSKNVMVFYIVFF